MRDWFSCSRDSIVSWFAASCSSFRWNRVVRLFRMSLTFCSRELYAASAFCFSARSVALACSSVSI